MLSIIAGALIFCLGYIFGAVSAYFILRKEARFKFEPKQIERIFILAIVAGVWFASNVYAIFDVSYQSPTALHALFGAVVGFYFDVALFDKLNVFKKK